jgi:hypothetical protein
MWLSFTAMPVEADGVWTKTLLALIVRCARAYTLRFRVIGFANLAGAAMNIQGTRRHLIAFAPAIHIALRALLAGCTAFRASD